MTDTTHPCSDGSCSVISSSQTSAAYQLLRLLKAGSLGSLAEPKGARQVDGNLGGSLDVLEQKQVQAIAG
jgi:hypothetical protein